MFEDTDQAETVKSLLAQRVVDIIRARGHSQTEAAEITGLTQPKLSSVLRGQLRGVSERRLLDCLTALGHDVKIVVTPARRCRQGALSVVP
ncbi:MAG: helix-turn-helix domain-containing protein [Panacagrimonas sp.]